MTKTRKGCKIAVTLDDYEAEMLGQIQQVYECDEPTALRIMARVGLQKVHDERMNRLLDGGHVQAANLNDMRWQEGRP